MFLKAYSLHIPTKLQCKIFTVQDNSTLILQGVLSHVPFKKEPYHEKYLTIKAQSHFCYSNILHFYRAFHFNFLGMPR